MTTATKTERKVKPAQYTITPKKGDPYTGTITEIATVFGFTHYPENADEESLLEWAKRCNNHVRKLVNPRYKRWATLYNPDRPQKAWRDRTSKGKECHYINFVDADGNEYTASVRVFGKFDPTSPQVHRREVVDHLLNALVKGVNDK